MLDDWWITHEVNTSSFFFLHHSALVVCGCAWARAFRYEMKCNLRYLSFCSLNTEMIWNTLGSLCFRFLQAIDCASKMRCYPVCCWTKQPHTKWTTKPKRGNRKFPKYSLCLINNFVHFQWLVIHSITRSHNMHDIF